MCWYIVIVCRPLLEDFQKLLEENSSTILLTAPCISQRSGAPWYKYVCER